MYRAISWTMGGHVAGQIVRLGSNLLMTRLLVPEMFGVMWIVTVVLMGLTLFSDVGLLQSIVRSNRGGDPKFLNTAWVIQIGRGVFLVLIALLFSWLLSIAGGNHWLPSNSAYADPILPLLIAVMSIQPLMAGFTSTKFLTAYRKLHIGRVMAINLSSQAIGVTVMVVWAWLDPTIWTLVIGSLVQVMLKVIFSHTMMPGVANKFEWENSAFFEIFHFGKWIFVSTIFGFLSNAGDRLLLGGLVSSSVLGVYSIAFFLAHSITAAITAIIGSVFFPALSEVARDNPDRLSEIYYKIRMRIDSVAFLGSGFIFIAGSTIVKILYDDRYLAAGWMLEILSLSIISVGFMLSQQCFLALGHVKVPVILNAIQALILFISLPLMFYFFGLLGAVWAVSLTKLIRIMGSLFFMKNTN